MCQKFEKGKFHGKIEHLLEADGLVAAITHRRKGRMIPEHMHDFGVFVTLLSGRHHWVDESGGIHWSLPGAWYYYPANVVHSHSAPKSNIISLGIQFDPNLFGIGESIPAGASVDCPEARRLTEALRKELEHPDLASSHMVRAAFFELVGYFLRSPETTAHFEAPQWVEQARSILDSKFRMPVSLYSLAQEVSMHPAHLARSFKKHFGMSVGEYVRDRRLEWAYKKLASSQFKLSEIALAAGFADHAHFSRAFRARYAMTPSECRIRLRNRAG
ncbi:MAG: helix-turn-helix transcriptional regulator [Chthonomonas sp.]|nr:helix-turn-helix transcriptional regulator [Chthonomonas sp.]